MEINSKHLKKKKILFAFLEIISLYLQPYSSFIAIKLIKTCNYGNTAFSLFFRKRL